MHEEFRAAEEEPVGGESNVMVLGEILLERTLKEEIMCQIMVHSLMSSNDWSTVL
jgi:hypothetical protein